MESNNQRFCGSFKNKKGCSWEKYKERRKKDIKIQISRNKKRRREKIKYCKTCGSQKIGGIFGKVWSWRCPTPHKHPNFHNGRQLKLRFLIFKKYDFTCQYCGRKAPKVELHIDHIVPKSKGGKNEESNYTVACLECNIGKGDILLLSTSLAF